MMTRRRCCCGGGGCGSCPTCPGVDVCRSLTISWSNLQSGGGSATMLNDAGGCTWLGTCGSIFGNLLAAYDMSGPTPVLRIRRFNVGECPDGTPTVDCSGLTLTYSNCPFLQTSWSVTSSNCPGLYSLGFRTFTVTF